MKTIRIENTQDYLNRPMVKDMDIGCNNPQDSVRVEISAEKILELLVCKRLCAADVRCMNPDSKKILMELCLTSCAYDMD